MFNNSFKNKKVLITGNTGFKGSWLSAWLLSLGSKVYGLSKDIPTKPSMYKVLKLDREITHYTCDIRDLNKTKNIIEKIKPDFLFHMAAQPIVAKSFSDPIETISSNVIGTTNILESLKIINNNCIAVIITSDKCYDNVEWVWGYRETDSLGGKDIYSGSKAAAEMIFYSYYHSFFHNTQKYNIRLATVRAGNVIGGGDWADFRIVPDCMKAWSKGESVEIRSPESTRPWQHVLEPLSGYLNIAQKLTQNISLNGESFNFGPNNDYSKTVKDLLDDLSDYWNFKHESAIISNDIIEFNESNLLKLNNDKALFYLKWLNTLDYKKLIEFTSLWYFNYYSSKRDMLKFTLNQIKQYEDIAKSKGILWAI